MTREKNPKYESMSLEELKANMEKSKKELEQAMHNKNILEQRKKLIERKERSHRLVVKGAEFEKAFPTSKDLEQEDFQKVMNEMKVLKYNRDTVRERYLEAGRKERQQIAEEVKKLRREMIADGTLSFFCKAGIQRKRADSGEFRCVYFRAKIV